jgi:anaerobic selenocysteine-containing dehydrogenase
MGTTRTGVCNLCEAICGLEITVEGTGDHEQVTSIRGNRADPLSRGHVCPKGVALADIHTDPDRLRRPVRRIGRGAEARWEELDWDSALDLVAEQLAATITSYGADAVGIYSGNPNAHSLGFATHGTPFIKSLRTRTRFSASTVDQVPHQLVSWLLYGHQLLIPVPDIDRTSYFLVLGANPMASNGSLMTVPDFPNRVRELHARGGRMVVLDPRRTETAKVADEHHFVRPGTDAWLLLAMLQVLLSEGLATPPSYVDDVDRVRELVADVTPEVAERRCGVPAAEIRRLVRDLAAADGGCVYGRVGVSTQGFGSVCHWAIACLNILTGNLDRAGGVLFPEPAIDTVGRRIVGPGHHDVWRSRVRGFPEFAGELPSSVMREEIETPGEGQVRTMVTLAGNPVLSTPDGAGLSRALAGLDFMVSIDIYLNETTRHADVVLPTTTALERDQYDLVFHGFAVRNTARFTPAVLARSQDSRHDWEIYAELAVRVAEKLGAPVEKLDALREQLATPPTTLVELLLESGGRTTMAELLAHPEGVDLGPLRPTLPGRLQTEDRRIHLAPTLVADDLVRLRAAFPAFSSDPALAAFEGSRDDLLLIGRRHQRDCNSWMHNIERLTRGRARHQLLVHPDDLAARGIASGSVVAVTSRVGRVEVEVLAADDMMPGVVSLPHGYGHGAEGTRTAHADTVAGVSINDLTDPDLLDVSGNAAFNGVRVQIASLAQVGSGTQLTVAPV